MTKNLFTGLNIQYPISELILSRKKTIETRTYPISKHYLNEDMVMIETPGKLGKFKSRAVAIIRITNCFQYKTKSEFYKDSDKHFVTPDSHWAWKDKSKFGWEVRIIKVLKHPITIKQTKGIIYTCNINLEI